MTRKCSDLKKNEEVVFLTNDYHIFKRLMPINGNVTSVDIERKIVHVVYLEGYHCRNEAIPFERMLAVANPEGRVWQFEDIKGKCDLLKGE